MLPNAFISVDKYSTSTCCCKAAVQRQSHCHYQDNSRGSAPAGAQASQHHRQYSTTIAHPPAPMTSSSSYVMSQLKASPATSKAWRRSTTAALHTVCGIRGADLIWLTLAADSCSKSVNFLEQPERFQLGKSAQFCHLYHCDAVEHPTASSDARPMVSVLTFSHVY